MTRLSCHRFRSNQVRLTLSLLAYNLGNLWRRLGTAPTNRELVVDEFAATAGEDRRTAGQTCALLLAILGGRTSEPAAIRGDAGSDRATAGTDGINRWWVRLAADPFYGGLGSGEVSLNWGLESGNFRCPGSESRIAARDPDENCFTRSPNSGRAYNQRRFLNKKEMLANGLIERF
jgi:hypothetical protein